MAYFVADEKLQGYYVSDGVTINIVKYHFECDDAASLPAQTAFISSKKVKISMASTAHTIDTDALYEMDSSGAWVQHSQPWQPLADYSVLSNKPQINGHALTGNQSGADLGLQNVLTFDNTPTQDSANPVTSGGIWTDQQRQDELQTEDRAALIEIVDGGAKNWAKIPSQNSASSNISFVTQADGGIKVTGTANFQSSLAKIVLTNSPVDQQETVTVEGKLPDKLAISGLGASTQLSRFVVNLYNGSTWVYAFNSNDVLHDISQYTYDRYNIVLIVPNNKTYNETIYPMICTQTAWEISQTFQPYRPSWQEMYEMILALQ